MDNLYLRRFFTEYVALKEARQIPTAGTDLSSYCTSCPSDRELHIACSNGDLHLPVVSELYCCISLNCIGPYDDDSEAG